MLGPRKNATAVQVPESVMVDLSWFRRRQQARLRPYDKPTRERHILSIVFSCLSVALLVLSLALQEWGKADINGCKFTFKLTQVEIKSQSNKELTYTSETKALDIVWQR